MTTTPVTESLLAFLTWLDPMPLAVKLYIVGMALLAVWVVWRIFGPNGSAW